MFINSGNLKITLICASIGFIITIIYLKIRSRKNSKEHEVVIRNASKQWIQNEKKRVQKNEDFWL